MKAFHCATETAPVYHLAEFTQQPFESTCTQRCFQEKIVEYVAFGFSLALKKWF